MAIPLSYTARMNYDCPKCGAKKGDFCVKPSGKPFYGTGNVHSVRINQVTSLEAQASIVRSSFPS